MNKENAKQNVASGISSTIGAAVGVVAGTMASNEMHAAESDEATVTDATPAEETADEDVPVVDVDPAQAPAAEPKICSQAGFAGASRISFNFL